MFKVRYKVLKFCLFQLALLLPFLFLETSANAQSVRSDRTTGTVVDDSSTFTVTEGTIREASSDGSSALFHSFETFTPAATDVVFDLRAARNIVDTGSVAAIISRVTGQSASFIDGQLSILQDRNTPAPDLFLINPNGIRFGENARLNLPSSFLASTAGSVLFDREQTFSTISPNEAPLLTISSPLGLQMNASSSRISVEGVGHTVASSNPLLAPYLPTGANEGLNVEVGNTLSLIGSQVSLEGGILSAPSGDIEIASVAAGVVMLEEEQAKYSSVEAFGTLELSRSSLLDTSGTAPGEIRLYGENVSLSDGSLVFSQNYGSQAGSTVSVNAGRQLFISGTTPTANAVSRILTETLAPGSAGNLTIDAPWLVVDAGAAIGSRSFSTGDSGNIEIDADRIDISGFVIAAPGIFSFVGTTSFLSGRAGDVTTSVGNLAVTEGGFLGSTTLGTGRGGNVSIDAMAVDVLGATPSGSNSLIAATTVGRQGDSGNLSLRATRIRLLDSGLLSTTSVGIGDAGDIVVEASESIEISGGSPNALNSSIASTVDVPPLAFQQLLGLPEEVRGTAGDITISTPSLAVSDFGAVTVANHREGDAGDLKIDADTIVLERNGGISALTASGEGGSISLSLQELLFMRDQGRISAQASTDGNGGNINISSPVIVGIGNSDILASATTGSGGNINLTTQGLVGIVPRAQQTPESDVTASSQFGLSGSISISAVETNLQSGLVELSNEVSDPDTQVDRGCSTALGNQFIVSGRGGLPSPPTSFVHNPSPWIDTRELPRLSDETDASAPEVSEPQILGETLTEASSWQRDAFGQVVLTASSSVSSALSSTTSCQTQE